jgi:hypothetical protein
MSVTNQTDVLVSGKGAVIDYVKPAANINYIKASSKINYVLAAADVRTVLDSGDLFYLDNRLRDLVVASDVIGKHINIVMMSSVQATDLVPRHFAGLLNESVLNGIDMLTTEVDEVPEDQITVTIT